MGLSAMSLAQFADPSQLEGAFWALPKGGSLIFAQGPSSLGGASNATVLLVQGWVKEGQATTASGRDPRNREAWIYRVYRQAAEAPKAPAIKGSPAPGQPPVNDPNWEESAVGMVYRMLRRCAQRGWPCPTNDAIAEHLNFESHEQARYRFNQLVRDGLVRVIEPARFSTRVIEITATGERTAPSHLDQAAGRITPARQSGSN